MHLGRAPQRVGVLHACAVGAAVARHDLRLGEQCVQVRRRGRLARVWPQRLEVGCEYAVGTERRLHAHRGGQVRDVEQPREVAGGERELAQHAVGAIGEREAFFLGERDGLDASGSERVNGGHDIACRVVDLALPHQCERDGGERREVTRTAERAVLRHHGHDVRVQQRRKCAGDARSHAGVPGRESAESQQHHRAHDLALHRVTGASGVRADQGPLQPRAVIRRDVPDGERAETGRDAVRGFRVGGERVDVASRGLDAVDRVVGERDLGGGLGDADDLLDGQRAGSDQQGVAVHDAIAQGILASFTPTHRQTVWDLRPARRGGVWRLPTALALRPPGVGDDGTWPRRSMAVARDHRRRVPRAHAVRWGQRRAATSRVASAWRAPVPGPACRVAPCIRRR